jgi:dynein heavy chain
MWVRAMHTYYNVAKSVAPKRAQLAEANAKLEVTMGQLKVAQAKLKEVEDRIAGLEAQLSAAVAKKDELAKQVRTFCRNNIWSVFFKSRIFSSVGCSSMAGEGV